MVCLCLISQRLRILNSKQPKKVDTSDKLDNIVFNKEEGLFDYKKLLKRITSISISNIEGLYNIGTKIVNLNGQLLLENKKIN